MGFSLSSFGIDEDALPHGWRPSRIDDISRLNPDQVTANYHHTEIAYLDIGNVGAGRIGNPTILPLAEAPSRAKRIVKPYDTILSTVRPGNRAFAFLKDVPDNMVVSTGFAVLRAEPTNADPRYLYFVTTSDPIIDYLASIAEEKTAYPSVNPNDIGECVVPLPPLPTQRAIARILGALDDKIELNRRMNETLEVTARAIFKSWFIDFDPVRAKVKGRQPEGMDPATAELFPDSFEDSELGEVPKKWRVEPFGEHLSATRGLSYNGDGLRDDQTGLPMHNLNSIYEGGGYKHEGIKYYAGEYQERHLLSPGDMIVTNTEQGFDHLLIGHAAIVPARYGERGLFSHHIYRVQMKLSSPFTPHYLVELFNSRRWHQWIAGFSNGTTINMLPLDALELPLLVVPPPALIDKYSALAAGIHDQIEDNLVQSHTLAFLRDALLPKLLSGELAV